MSTDVSKRKSIKKIFRHIICVLICLLMLYPLLWMIFSSFKDTDFIIRESHRLFPDRWTFQNYVNGWRGFSKITFGTYFKNSIVISVTSTIGAVFSSLLIAFGFARMKVPGSRFWFSCVMISLMLPFQVLMIPQFIIYSKLGWVGTYLPLIVPYFFGQAFFIFMDMQFIRGIPKELDEAARIDGCGVFGIFRYIIFPQCVPVIITSTIFSFIWRWQDFMSAFLFIHNPQKYPASIALKCFSDPGASTDFGAMFAMSALSILPSCLLFLFFQKYLVEGNAATGLKG